jgi:lactate racemase
MVTPLDILEPGGTLLIASSCSEGFGSPEFREAQAKMVAIGPEPFLATLTAKSLADIDEWQTQMQTKAMRLGRVELYTTGLDEEEQRITGVTMTTNIDKSLHDAIERHDDPDVAFIPEGPYVVPVFAGG